MPIRVVLVDDTDSLRSLMREHVEHESDMVVVGEAGNGVDGLDIVRSTQPDAVILDVEMPVMDGLQALPQLRQAAPDAKIVVFSSRVDQPTQTAALAQGADGYFLKGEVASSDVVHHLRLLCGGAEIP